MPAERDRGRRRRALTVLLLLLLAQALPARAAAAPLSDTDRELLVRVRQAGLWEMPSSDWARTSGTHSRVREIGLTLLVDHGRLDAQTVELAERLDVELPDRPTVDQLRWLDEMRAAQGAEFDRIFVDRLRIAHGKIFSFIAQVRSGTRHEEIRAYATTANAAVLRHMTLLESTGLFDYERFPAPVLDASATSAGAALDVEASDVAVLAVLGALVCGATLLLLRLAGNARARAAREPTHTTRSGDSHA
ncbi:putative outer membrane protein [Prauserella shujinwangii]|uniref:Putative outer membrane protein n=1 Tax=Prauserella shujinwangii TaxID=1453103 RepID=A0A2T0M3H0_9PSEU|nr:DUF4142 domain-containing protein [Prauserella shujinwangii]PRX51294.1 putative outer membrane protein [Prauserella shujinwangii]